MRLAATVEHPAVLYRLGTAFEKLDKQWILKFSSDLLSIIVVNQSVYSRVRMWSSVNQDSIFEEYQIESKYHNTIHLEICGEHLLRALKSGYDALTVTMKLIQSGGLPFLSFIISTQSKTGKFLQLTHNVPCSVISPLKAEEFYKEPSLPLADCKIPLRKIELVCRILERLKLISHELKVVATTQNHLELHVSSDMATVEATFDDEVGGEESVAILVDIRDMIKALNCELFHPSSVVVGFFKSSGLLIGAALRNGEDTEIARMNYYIPNKI